jgi:hypothetical protein
LPHCKECGLVNLWAERHPHPNVVRAELAEIIREKNRQAKKDRKAFRKNLRLNMRDELFISRQSSMSEFTRQQLLAGERILNELYARGQNGGTVTN